MSSTTVLTLTGAGLPIALSGCYTITVSGVCYINTVTAYGDPGLIVGATNVTWTSGCSGS